MYIYIQMTWIFVKGLYKFFNERVIVELSHLF
jgi:hypothetical protein